MKNSQLGGFFFIGGSSLFRLCFCLAPQERAFTSLHTDCVCFSCRSSSLCRDKDLLRGGGGESLNAEKEQAERRCEGGESAGSNRGGTEAAPESPSGAVRSAPPQSPCCESHKPAQDRSDQLPQLGQPNELRLFRWRGAKLPAFVLLSRHLGFTDDVTSILNVMPLAAIILDFDSIPCSEPGSCKAFMTIQVLVENTRVFLEGM